VTAHSVGEDPESYKNLQSFTAPTHRSMAPSKTLKGTDLVHGDDVAKDFGSGVAPAISVSASQYITPGVKPPHLLTTNA